MGVLYLAINSGKALFSAVTWGVAVLVLGLLFQGMELGVILWAFVTLLSALAFFFLLDWLEGNSFYWLVFIAGIPLFLII